MRAPGARIRTLIATFIVAVAWSSPALALSPGSLDPSFASGGTLVHQFGASSAPWSQGWAVAVQPDGKIVTAGLATTSSGSDEVLVVRLNGDGSLDTSFGTGGVVTRQFGQGGSPTSLANSLVIQSDGKIVIAGKASDSNGHTAVMVARLNPDGSLDSSFNSTGVLVSQQGSNLITDPVSEADSVVLQGSKILLGGSARDSHKNDQFMLLRLNGDGSPDSTFGSGGAILGLSSGGTSRINSLALQSDGKIVAGGVAGRDLLVARLNASDGGFDLSFGSGGTVIQQLGTTATNPFSQALGLAVQPDGKIVAGGNLTDASGNGLAMLARLNPDGSFDSTFGSNGVVSTQFGSPAGGFPAASYIHGLLLQPNGKIVTGVFASSDTNALEVTRFDGNGSLDSSFGSGGIVQTAQGAGLNSDQDGLALQPDGKILDSGEVSASSTPNTAQLFITRVIGDSPPPTPTPSSSAVQLTGVSQSHRHWREGSALPHVARVKRPPVGTTFRFSVNQTATVGFAFTQRLPGRKVGHRCVAPSKKNRHKPKCTRTVTRGKLSFSVGAGPHKVRFDGRLSKHKKLPPGRYGLVITASNGSGPPATEKLTFTIVKG